MAERESAAIVADDASTSVTADRGPPATTHAVATLGALGASKATNGADVAASSAAVTAPSPVIAMTSPGPLKMTPTMQINHVPTATASPEPREEHEQPLALAPPAKKRKFVHTSQAQRRCLLEWLENPINFRLLTAPATVPVNASPSGECLTAPLSGKRVKKTDGFRALMRHVNACTQAGWTMARTKSRFESFVLSYRKVKALAGGPEFASLPETERLEKLEAMCPMFERIDALFDPPSGSSCPHDKPASTTAEETATPTIAILPRVAEVDLTRQRRRIRAVEVRVKRQRDQHPKPESDNSDDMALPSDDLLREHLALEKKKLQLLEDQIDLQRRELEIREREVRLQEHRLVVRAELVSELIQAGKNPNQVDEYLARVTDSQPLNGAL